MKYKSSMFNYVFESGEEMILLNTMHGISSACRVREEDCEKVKTLLQGEKAGVEIDPEEKIEKSLIEKGFLVLEEKNEKAEREAVYSRIASGQGGQLRLIILPTEQCNYRCKYCYESFTKGKMSEETEKAIIKYIRKYISKYSSLRISWFGGEPLLALDVIERISTKVMEICKKARRPYTADMTTNGYLLTLETFRKLLSWNVLGYQITIDGVKEIHDNKKPLADGRGTFDVVTNNLRMIRQEVKSSTYSITVRSNVTSDALVSMDEFTGFFQEMVGDDPRFSFFLRPAGDWGGENRLSEMVQGRIDESQIGCVYRNFAKNGSSLNIDTHRGFYNQGGCMCYACNINCLVISSDGDIRKCTCDLDSEEYSIGKLLPSGEMDIDQEKHSRWFGNVTRFSEKCDECAFSPICFAACCPRDNIFNWTEGKKIKCPSEMESLFETLNFIDSHERFPYLGESSEGEE